MRYPIHRGTALLRMGLVTLTLVALPACSSGSGAGAGATAGGRGADAARDEGTAGARLGDQRQVQASAMSGLERQRVAQAWQQFLDHSRLWPLSLKGVVDTGGAGPYVLAENLFTYFFRASIANKRGEIDRVAESVAVIGEPAVAYFAKPLVTDLVPLGKEVVCEVPDPDDPKSRIKKKFRHFQIDDFTRRDAARVLVAIGAPAVETLSSRAVLVDARPSGRRYAAFALGRIGTDAAVRALTRQYETQSDWQDRAAAVQALGAALESNPQAKATLEKALRDRDPFVRKQADRALAGKAKLPI